MNETQNQNQKVWYPNFPILSRLINIETPQNILVKSLFVVFLVVCGIIAAIIDVIIFWIILSILRGLKWIAKEILQEIIHTFLAKILAISAIVIIAFLVFVIIKSGAWVRLYDGCVAFAQ